MNAKTLGRVAVGGTVLATGALLLWPKKARASVWDIPLLSESVAVPPRPPLSTFERPDLIPVAEAAARKYVVPVEGFVQQIWKESRFSPTAGSPVGAQGIAQFIPATAASYGIDPWEPHQALDAAARMMRNLHRQFGSWGLAAAAYNWGSGNVQKWQRGERQTNSEVRDYTAVLAPAYGESDPLAASA